MNEWTKNIIETAVVFVPLFVFAVRIEHRLTRLETKLDSIGCCNEQEEVIKENVNEHC